MMAPGSIVRREDIEALLRKPLEEAVRVPLRAFGTVGHRLRQRAQQVVEAAGALQIYRLFEVVGRRVVAFLQPGFRRLGSQNISAAAVASVLTGAVFAGAAALVALLSSGMPGFGLTDSNTFDTDRKSV